MKKIYNFINGVELLNLYGTYEQGEEEEGEVYCNTISGAIILYPVRCTRCSTSAPSSRPPPTSG